MAEYENKVRDVLAAHGYTLHHHGRGDHDIWYNPVMNIKVTVDGKIKSRHMANQIMKQAGIDHHF